MDLAFGASPSRIRSQKAHRPWKPNACRSMLYKLSVRSAQRRWHNSRRNNIAALVTECRYKAPVICGEPPNKPAPNLVLLKFVDQVLNRLFARDLIRFLVAQLSEGAIELIVDRLPRVEALWSELIRSVIPTGFESRETRMSTGNVTGLR